MPTNWYVLYGAISDFVLASLYHRHTSYPQPHRLLLDSDVFDHDVPLDDHFTYQANFLNSPPLLLYMNNNIQTLTRLSSFFWKPQSIHDQHSETPLVQTS